MSSTACRRARSATRARTRSRRCSIRPSRPTSISWPMEPADTSFPPPSPSRTAMSPSCACASASQTGPAGSRGDRPASLNLCAARTRVYRFAMTIVSMTRIRRSAWQPRRRALALGDQERQRPQPGPAPAHPAGFDGLEPAARTLAAERFKRGSFQAALSFDTAESGRGLRVDPAALAAAIRIAKEVAAGNRHDAGADRRPPGAQGRHRAGRGGADGRARARRPRRGDPGDSRHRLRRAGPCPRQRRQQAPARSSPPRWTRSRR